MVDRSAESDLRRRAAWLLGMLGVVAVLFVVILTVVLNTSSGDKAVHSTAGALDSAANGQQSTGRSSAHAAPSSSAGATAGSPSTSITTQPATGDTTCPTTTPCALAGDAGGAVAAVNAARAADHQAPISGQTSAAAQQCALTKGNGCAGSWAVTWGSAADGAGLVARIPDHAELLSPDLTGFQVGWAYFPGEKTYYLAIIRNS